MAGRRRSDVDHHVGRRIRQRRNALVMSQNKLGNVLGISFQQIQKYEVGTNRIAAGRLWNIAVALDVEVAYFFPGSPVEPQPTAMPAGALVPVTSTYKPMTRDRKNSAPLTTCSP